jgi:hypothetical protein
MLLAGCFLSLQFDPEDGRITFLRNVRVGLHGVTSEK